MGSLLTTIIGIIFCALLLAAGANYLQPKAFIEHNLADTNNSQIESLVADYNNLAMANGHRPSSADYAAVYANGSANSKYTINNINNGTTITTGATMAYKDSSGQMQPVGTWQFISAACGTGGTQDCFCLPVQNATDVTYAATHMSALKQMDSSSQSRVEFSASGCNDTAPITDPSKWPATTQSSYYLIVALNNASASNPNNPSNPTAVNGACGTGGACTSGTGSVPFDNGTTTTWTCSGSNGGSTASCSFNDPPSAVNGACGAAAGACTAGIQTSYNASAGTWICDGQNGGSNSSQCTVQIAGVCNTAADTCSTGTAASYNAGAGTWTCTGLNGGSSAACTAPIAGACGTAADTCSLGTAAGYSATAGTWTCSGLNGGSSASCTVPVNGVCSTAANTCTTGTAASYNPAAGSWTCNGLNGGSGASCIVPINGACGTTADTCSTGTSAGYSATAGSWTCTGLNNGSTASCTVPINGACGTAAGNCTIGTASGTSDANGATSWNCAGLNGGTTTSCNTTDPVNGACGTAADTCTTGSPTGQGDNGTNKFWTCAGSNGGTNSGQCTAVDYTGTWQPLVGSCSNSCGTGTAITTYVCGGNGPCAQPGPASTQASCTDTSGCTYSVASTVGACAASCGASTQPISYTCTRSDGTVVANSNCSGAQPATQACSNYGTCSYAVSSNYATCDCTGHSSLQSWSCTRSDGTNMGEDTTDCTAPAATQTCTPPSSCGPTYTTGLANFGTCSNDCGYGTETAASWTCYGSDGSVTTGTPGSSLCPAPTTTSRACTNNSGCTLANAYNTGGEFCGDGRVDLNPNWGCTNSQGSPAPDISWCGTPASEINNAQTDCPNLCSDGSGNDCAPVTATSVDFNVTYSVCAPACGHSTAPLDNSGTCTVSQGDYSGTNYNYCANLSCVTTYPISQCPYLTDPVAPCVSYATCNISTVYGACDPVTHTKSVISFSCTDSNGNFADGCPVPPPAACP